MGLEAAVHIELGGGLPDLSGAANDGDKCALAPYV